jgi:CRP-like cAMP-binding protein
MASAVSVGFCDIYVLEKELFDKVVNAHPAFRSHLQEVISQRKAA